MEILDNLNNVKDFKKVKRCIFCDRKMNPLSRRYSFCVICFDKLPKEIHVQLKQAKKDDNFEEMKR